MRRKAQMEDKKAPATMYEIDLSNYEVDTEDNGKTVKVPFHVAESLASLVFHSDLKLTVEQSFESYELARRIRSAGSKILVDSKEMKRLKDAYNVMRSPGESALECLRRIRDARKVEVEEVKAEKPG